jgi:hypothetical protein
VDNNNWETRNIDIVKWRKFNSRWFQLVVKDKDGKERFFIMKEVKELKEHQQDNEL